jgi:hypothetical protein
MVAPMTKGIADVIREMRRFTMSRRGCDIAIVEQVEEWADHLEAVQTPQEESGFRIERTKDDPSLVRVINVHGSFLVKVAPDTSAPFKSGSAVQTPPTEKE